MAADHRTGRGPVHDDRLLPQAPGDRAGRGLTPGAGRRALEAALWALLLVALSLVAVLRHIGPHLHADGVMQSVMSVQGVELFFWGQNRFASVVPFLASVVADPDANLFACLLLNALSFHGLLLLLAWAGAAAVAGNRSWPSVLLLFLIMVAIAHLTVVPYQIYTFALDTQPYSLSWLLALGSFLLWRTSSAGPRVAAIALIGLAVGLNQSVVLGAGFLALVEAIRRHRWRRWLLFGAVWAGWLVVWFGLALRFGRTDAVGQGLATSYYTFDVGQFADGLRRSVQAVFAAFSTGALVGSAVLAALALTVLDRTRRRLLARRFALLAAFCAGYLLLFAGNNWIAANNYPVRYFFPVVVGIVVALAAPIAAAAAALGRRRHHPAARGAPLVVAGAVGVAALAGPLTTPAHAWIFTDVRDSARFAAARDVNFVAGNYWVVWPLLDRLLADGRPVLAANYKAGGDPDRYARRLDEVIAGGTVPRAMCVNDTVDGCVDQLDRWTRPGWQPVAGGNCPISEPPSYADSAERSCLILEFRK